MKISVTIRIQIHIIYMYQKDRTYSKGDLRNTVIFKKKKKRIGFGSWQFSRGELGCPVGFGAPIGPSAACCPGLEEAGSFRPLLRITL